jgi:hypothetical protein
MADPTWAFPHTEDPFKPCPHECREHGQPRLKDFQPRLPLEDNTGGSAQADPLPPLPAVFSPEWVEAIKPGLRKIYERCKEDSPPPAPVCPTCNVSDLIEVHGHQQCRLCGRVFITCCE